MVLKLSLLINDDETYTIEEAVNNGFLRMGDWFEYKGDMYILIKRYDDEDGYVAYRLNKEGFRFKQESIRDKYRLITYDIFINGGMFELYENEVVSYHFVKEQKVQTIRFTERW